MRGVRVACVEGSMGCRGSLEVGVDMPPGQQEEREGTLQALAPLGLVRVLEE
jgi:hypothetical protein